VELKSIDQIVVDSLYSALCVIQLQSHCLLQEVSLVLDVLDIRVHLLDPLVILLLHAAVEPCNEGWVFCLSEELQLVFAIQILNLHREIVLHVLQIWRHFIFVGLLQFVLFQFVL